MVKMCHYNEEKVGLVLQRRWVITPALQPGDGTAVCILYTRGLWKRCSGQPVRAQTSPHTANVNSARLAPLLGQTHASGAGICLRDASSRASAGTSKKKETRYLNATESCEHKEMEWLHKGL